MISAVQFYFSRGRIPARIGNLCEHIHQKTNLSPFTPNQLTIFVHHTHLITQPVTHIYKHTSHRHQPTQPNHQSLHANFEKRPKELAPIPDPRSKDQKTYTRTNKSLINFPSYGNTDLPLVPLCGVSPNITQHSPLANPIQHNTLLRTHKQATANPNPPINRFMLLSRKHLKASP